MYVQYIKALKVLQNQKVREAFGFFFLWLI